MSNRQLAMFAFLAWSSGLLAGRSIAFFYEGETTGGYIAAIMAIGAFEIGWLLTARSPEA